MLAPMRSAPVALLVAGTLLAGCGGESAPESDTDRYRGDVPGFRTPESDRRYDTGGADGSGASGETGFSERGGVAGGPDSPAGVPPHLRTP
jgi:hypothetical protein